MKASDYLIGVNDTCGIDPPTTGRLTPPLPYSERIVYENEAAKALKIYFMIAALGCGFNTLDIHPELFDISVNMRISRANAADLTALVTFGYNSFGSGDRFNSVNGLITYYSNAAVNAVRSRIIAEDIFLSIVNNSLLTVGRGVSTITPSNILEKVNCPSITVLPGYMTNLTEARLMLDPDWCSSIAKTAAEGLCSSLGVSYFDKEISAYPTVKTGSGNSYVKIAQLYFILNGHDIVADGIFGQKTLEATLAFQSQNGLISDGIIGGNTWIKLARPTPASSIITVRSEGTNVIYLQQKLESKLYPLDVDGIFGDETLIQLKAFQSESGLKCDGIVGPMTWSKIRLITSPRE